MIDFRKFFSREVKIFLLIVLSVTLLAVAVVVTAHLFTRPPEAKSRRSLPALEGAEEADVSVYDLAVPDEIYRFLSPKPRYFREPRKVWSRQEVEEHWIDPRRLGIDILTEENRKLLGEMLDSVP